MLRKIHPAAGIISFLTILTFWYATVAAGLSGKGETVLIVRTVVLWGMLLFVPALIVSGVTGFRQAGRRAKGLVRSKKRRMPVIMASGILVLVPCAVYLHRLAVAREFDATFYAVQAVELIVGLGNLVLMGLNMRDGIRIARRRRRRERGLPPRA